jgi:hypothetical protein
MRFGSGYYSRSATSTFVINLVLMSVNMILMVMRLNRCPVVIILAVSALVVMLVSDELFVSVSLITNPNIPLLSPEQHTDPHSLCSLSTPSAS